MGSSTDEFFRLFMVPGMFHCGGGVGTSQFDMTTPLLKWAEEDIAPVRIEARRAVAGKVVRTRPLCAYPHNRAVHGHGQHRRCGELYLREAERVIRATHRTFGQS